MSAVDLHHEVTGSAAAPPLLLGSSLGTTLRLWDPQLTALEAHLRVVRYDHRGHGRSPVPAPPYALDDLGRDVLRLLDKLDIARISVLGTSLGGMVGMWLAGMAPERVDRLVLCCTSAHLPPASAWAERAAAVEAAGTTEVIADAVVARWLTPGWAREHPDTAAWLRDMLVATPPAGYAGGCRVIERMDLRPRLGAIRAPTLVIAGADDPATPPDHGRRIADAIPGARLEILAGAAHQACVERAGDVTRLVLDHLREPS